MSPITNIVDNTVSNKEPQTLKIIDKVQHIATLAKITQYHHQSLFSLLIKYFLKQFKHSARVNLNVSFESKLGANLVFRPPLVCPYVGIYRVYNKIEIIFYNLIKKLMLFNFLYNNYLCLQGDLKMK